MERVWPCVKGGRSAVSGESDKGRPKLKQGWTVSVLGDPTLVCWRCRPTRNWRAAARRGACVGPPAEDGLRGAGGKCAAEAEGIGSRARPCSLAAGTLARPDGPCRKHGRRRRQNAKSWDARRNEPRPHAATAGRRPRGARPTSPDSRLVQKASTPPTCKPPAPSSPNSKPTPPSKPPGRCGTRLLQ